MFAGRAPHDERSADSDALARAVEGFCVVALNGTIQLDFPTSPWGGIQKTTTCFSRYITQEKEHAECQAPASARFCRPQKPMHEPPTRDSRPLSAA